jgi:hypothetical protein
VELVEDHRIGIESGMPDILGGGLHLPGKAEDGHLPVVGLRFLDRFLQLPVLFGEYSGTFILKVWSTRRFLSLMASVVFQKVP